MSRYILGAGRCIIRDGVAIMTLHKVGAGLDNMPYALTPAEAEAFAHEVVDSLNAVQRASTESTGTLRELAAWVREHVPQVNHPTDPSRIALRDIFKKLYEG